MEEDEEVLFEAWAYKLKGADSKRSLRITGAWKKQYVLLWRKRQEAVIHCHDRKPSTLKDVPKLRVPLQPVFRIEKLPPLQNKEHVCELRTETRTLCLAFEEEKLFHLFTFYVQCQAKLRQQYWNECCVVRPDNSDDQRKLGARGNMCILHVSPWGVTLALELSKCILCQWPLKSIKSYEASGRNQFAFDTGRRAPMGAGVYVFNTRRNQDVELYDLLDRYVMEAANMSQLITPGSSTPSLDAPPSSGSQLMWLQSLTEVNADPQFVSQLRRISRDMYDQLSQHIGALSPSSGAARLAGASSTDMLNSTRSGQLDSSLTTVSTSLTTAGTPGGVTGTPVSMKRLSPRLTDPFQQGAIPVGREYENQSAESTQTTLRQQLVGSMGSDYLRMAGSRDDVHNARSQPIMIKAGANRPMRGGETNSHSQPATQSQISTESVRAERYMNSVEEPPPPPTTTTTTTTATSPQPSETYDTPVKQPPSPLPNTASPPYLLAKYAPESAANHKAGHINRDPPINDPANQRQGDIASDFTNIPGANHNAASKSDNFGAISKTNKPVVKNKPTVAGKPLVAKQPEFDDMKKAQVVNLPDNKVAPSLNNSVVHAVDNDYYTQPVDSQHQQQQQQQHQPIPRFGRLMSQSADNLSEYTSVDSANVDVGGSSSPDTLPYYTYDNSGYRHSAGSASSPEYSYATWDKSSAAFAKAGHADGPTSPTVILPAAGSGIDALYSRPLSRAMRKSVSLTDVLEGPAYYQTPGNQQQVPSNQQQMPSNQQQMPSNQQQMPSNQQHMPSNQQQMPSNQQHMPSNQQQMPSNQQQMPSNQQQMPSNQQHMPSNQQQMPSNQPKVLSNQPKMLNNRTYVDSNQTQMPGNQANLPSNQPQDNNNKKNFSPLVMPGPNQDSHFMSPVTASPGVSPAWLPGNSPAGASGVIPSFESSPGKSPGRVTMPGVKFTASSKSFRKIREESGSPVSDGRGSPLILRQKSSPNPNEGRRLPSLPPGAALKVGMATKNQETLC